MASEEQLSFNAPHPPRANAKLAFWHVQHDLKKAIVHSRNSWDAKGVMSAEGETHGTPQMWSRASKLSDHELTAFDLSPSSSKEADLTEADFESSDAAKDLILVSSAQASYGQVILGKIRIPGVNDDLGEGFIHVRIHDSPGDGVKNVTFHSIWTDEQRKHVGDHPSNYVAVQTKDEPLKFFNE